jgi:hypothetical protein
VLKAFDLRETSRNAVKRHYSTGGLRESISEFAGRRMFEETVAGLAAFTRLPISHIDSLFDEPPANLAILCKSVSLRWETARRILSLYAAETGQDAEVSKARSDYQRLTPAMAQRLVRFWNLKADPDAEVPREAPSLA